MIKYLILALSLSVATITSANELPGAPEGGEPDIRITYKDENTYYEYRVNGILKEIKVVPSVGKPYYLVPAKQGGGMQRVDKSTLLIPKWVIFSW